MPTSQPSDRPSARRSRPRDYIESSPNDRLALPPQVHGRPVYREVGSPGHIAYGGLPGPRATSRRDAEHRSHAWPRRLEPMTFRSSGIDTCAGQKAFGSLRAATRASTVGGTCTTSFVPPLCPRGAAPALHAPTSRGLSTPTLRESALGSLRNERLIGPCRAGSRSTTVGLVLRLCSDGYD